MKDNGTAPHMSAAPLQQLQHCHGDRPTSEILMIVPIALIQTFHVTGKLSLLDSESGESDGLNGRELEGHESGHGE